MLIFPPLFSSIPRSLLPIREDLKALSIGQKMGSVALALASIISVLCLAMPGL